MKAILKKMWKWIKSVFKWIFSNFKNFFLVILTVLAIVFFFSWKHAEKTAERVQIEAADTLTAYKNKNGELYAQIQGYIVDNRELKELNEELYQEVKNLKDNPIVVTKTEFVIQIDTLEIRDTVYQEAEGIFSSKFRYENQWVTIDGKSMFDLNKMNSTTYINDISLYADMYFDIVEKNKKEFAFIARSSNPYLHINNMSGAIVSPESSKMLKRRFQKPWGIMVGVGGTATIYNGRCIVVPGLQLTLGYQIVRF